MTRHQSFHPFRALQATAAALLLATAAPALAGAPEAAPAPEAEEMRTLVVFAATGPRVGREPFITDGTRAGTRLLRNLHREPPDARFPLSSNPAHLTSVGDGRAMFAANVPVRPGYWHYAPWVTDGTRAGTTRIRRTSTHFDIEYAPRDFTPLGDGRVIFLASGDGTESRAHTLWVTRGNRRSTRPILSIGQWGAGEFVSLGDGRAVFHHWDDVHGRELWVTNGTPRGTRLLVDIRPGTGWSGPTGLTPLGDGRVLFSAYMPDTLRYLWITDGTRRGTRQIEGLSSTPYYPSQFTAIGNGRALFMAVAPGGLRRMWITDGTPAGTHHLGFGGNMTGNITHLGGGRAVFTDYLYINDEWGRYLLVTRGTDASTRRIRKFETDNQPHHVPTGFVSLQDGRALFWQRRGGVFTRLWVTDGTRRGTVVIGNDGRVGAAQIPLLPIAPMGDGRALFQRFTEAHGEEPWITDGTRAGTRLLRNIHPGGHSQPREFAVLGRFPATHPVVRALDALAAEDGAEE